MQSRTIRAFGLATVILSLGAFAHGRVTEAPDSLEEGPITIRMVNEGRELHHVWLMRLGDGHTLDETFAAFKSTGRLPEWV